MKSLADSNRLKEELVKNGRNILSLYSWKMAATGTLAVYHRLDKKLNVWDKYYQLTKDKEAYLHSELIEAITGRLDIRGKRVLEVGSGRGRDGMYLSGQGAIVATIDSSFESTRIISAQAAKSGLRLSIIQADAWNLPFKDSSFDLVFHQGFLEHFRHPEKIISEQKEVLKNNGYILVDVPQRYNLWTLKKNILMILGLWFAGWETSFTLKGLKKLLKDNGFEIIGFYQRDYYPDIIRKIKNLKKIEEGIFRRKILPEKFWLAYRNLWENFEKTCLSRIIFKSIGVMARKIQA